MNKKEILDSDHILSLLLKLSIPTMIGGFTSALYNIVDSIFVGHYVGATGLVALTISNTIQLIFIAFSALFSVGSSTLISRALGAKQYEKVNHIIVTSSWAICLSTVMISILFLMFLTPILVMMGTVEEALSEAQTYISMILLFGFIVPMNGVFSAMLRAKGQANLAMILAILGAVLNIMLDAFLIIVMGWGVFGAAFATVVAQIIVFVCSIYYIQRVYQIQPFDKKYLSNDWSLLIQVISIGLPSGARMSVVSLASLFANRALAPYGVTALAAAGIVNRIVSLAFMPIQGCNFGAQPIIAFNYGARRLDRLKMIITKALIMMTAIGGVGTLGFIYAPVGLFKLFTMDTDIIAIAKEGLAYNGCLFVLFSFYMLLSGFVQSVGYIKEAMFLALIRPALNIVMFNIFPIYFGLKGVWFVMPVTDFINSVLAIAIAYNVFQRVKKDLETNNLHNIESEMVEL